jgi:hypothetical protein
MSIDKKTKSFFLYQFDEITSQSIVSQETGSSIPTPFF